MFCPGCNKEIPDAYAGVRCPSCGASLIPGSAPPGGGAPPLSGRPEGIPWENRRTLGLFPALFENLRLCLFDPQTFFTRMPPRENLGAALGYLAILGWVGAVGGFVWSLILKAPQQAMMRSFGIEPRPSPLPPAAMGAIYLCAVIFAPLFILLGAFIWSGILHVVLWIVGGAKEGFEATARVVAYASGSTYLFQLIPLCGGLVGGVWSLVLQIIGISRAHGISGGKAAAAVLLPLILCCGVLIALFAVFAGFIFSQLRGGTF